MAKFLFRFALFTLLLAVPPLFADIYFPDRHLLIDKFWVIFLFFTLLTLLVSLSVLFSMKKSDKMTIQVFMVATISKLLACLFFALIYISKYKGNDIHFVACFFYLYFLNTVFEIYSLLCNLRHQILK